jgi:hypothetical protein
MNKFASLTSGLLARKGTAEPAATTYAEELLKRVDATGPDFRTYGYSGSSAFGRRPTASESSLFLDRPEPVPVEAPVPPPAPAPANASLAPHRLPRRCDRGHDAWLPCGSRQDLPRQPAPQAQALCQAQACFCAAAPADAGHRQRCAGRMVRQAAARCSGRLRVHAWRMNLNTEVNAMVTITRPDELKSCRGPPHP